MDRRFPDAIHLRLQRTAAGLMLIETMLAMLVLSVAVLGIVYTTTASHQHLHHSDMAMRATRLAEHLLDEIAGRPYAGSGATRSTFHIDDYYNYYEAPGQITDAMGHAYGPEDQIFSRSVTVSSTSRTVPELGDAAIIGKMIQVTVEAPTGQRWRLQRFVPERAVP